MNIFSFTKEIINFGKLNNDLKENDDWGLFYDYFSYKDHALNVHFTENLTQDQINSLTFFVNNFVEVDVVEEEFNVTTLKQSDGWDLYKRIIAHMNTSGGLGTIDNGLIAYDALVKIRMLLKDGFYEYTLRTFVRDIVPLGFLTQDQIDLYKKWIRDAAMKYGTPSEILDLIEVAENI